jgi:hypothetical protein
MIRLDLVNGGFLITHIDSGRDILIQTDWDYPGLASSFGWRACTCGATDGTVNCKHKTASKMITSAYNFLVANDGECVEDPGYFD